MAATVAKAIADAFPKINCIVLDLPHVIEGCEGRKNLSYVGGDMLKSIPSADAILLKVILIFHISWLVLQFVLIFLQYLELFFYLKEG